MRATLQAADQLLRDERVQQILTNMSEMTDSARRVTANVEQMTDGVRLAPVVGDLRETTAEAKRLIVELRDGADRHRAAQRAARGRRPGAHRRSRSWSTCR